MGRDVTTHSVTAQSPGSVARVAFRTRLMWEGRLPHAMRRGMQAVLAESTGADEGGGAADGEAEDWRHDAIAGCRCLWA